MNLFFLITNINFHKYLNLKEFVDVFKINKKLNELNNFKYDYTWKYYCDLKFNSKFWDDAMILNKADYLGSWKYEYIRIINFENKLKDNGLTSWNKENYYNWWNICKRIKKDK